MKTVAVVVGTRPEAIKMIPVIKKLREKKIKLYVINTGQHEKMIDMIFDDFEEAYDFNLQVMNENNSLSSLASLILIKLDELLKSIKVDIILVHGDTLTSTVASLCAFWNKILVGHVEAGLRTNDIYSPFPEELNRQITARIANFHFAPTQMSKDNLICENIPLEKIFITGNTIIDALLLMHKQIKSNKNILIRIKNNLGNLIFDSPNKMILITGHRRENFGENFAAFAKAILYLSKKFPDVLFVYPVHLNPNVRQTFNSDYCFPSNVHLIEPLDYASFVFLLEKCYLVLTDSGGIQEEAPSFGKPVLIMRDNTERQEAVNAGCAKLIGMNYDSIIKEVESLLNNSDIYESMAIVSNPFGNGSASDLIINEILK